MIRLYIPEDLSSQALIEPSDSQTHYLLRVMRLKITDRVLVFNGRNGEWEAEIIHASKRSSMLRMDHQTRVQTQDPELHLLFPPLKPKRVEFLIEKGTELGVTHFHPIITGRTSSQKFNGEKSQIHALEASEQCERLTIPHLLPLEKLESKLKNWDRNTTIIVGDETHMSPPLLSAKLTPKLAFMVGPEGGWTPDELATFKNLKGLKSVDLGPLILRSETAAIVGIATLGQMRHTKS